MSHSKKNSIIVISAFVLVIILLGGILAGIMKGFRDWQVFQSYKANIVYSYNEPSDTSALWVMSKEPKKLTVTDDFVGSGELEYSIYNNLSSSKDSAACTVGTRIYLFGGVNGITATNSIRYFDAATNKLVQCNAVLPKEQRACSSVLVGDKIWIFSGTAGQYSRDPVAYLSDDSNYPPPVWAVYSEIYIYDYIQDVIETIDIKLSYSGVNAVLFDSVIYVFGGFQPDKSMGCFNGTCFYDSFVLKSKNVYAINPENQTMTVLPFEFPCDICYANVIQYGNYVYFFDTSSIYRLNMETFKFETLDCQMSDSLYGRSSIRFGSSVYFFGGRNDSGYSTSIDIFDLKRETFSSFGTLDNGISLAPVAMVENTLYLFGVLSNTSVERIQFKVPLEKNTLLIDNSGKENSFTVINRLGEEEVVQIAGVYIGNSNGYAESVIAYLYDENIKQWKQISGLLIDI